jgi:hypothetical protein
MEEQKYLYKVTLKGMCYGITHEKIHGIAYVVATNLNDAYQKVKDKLDEKDYGFTYERQLDKIEIIADTSWYGNTDYMLYL